jgi:hypothetical protein
MRQRTALHHALKFPGLEPIRREGNCRYFGILFSPLQSRADARKRNGGICLSVPACRHPLGIRLPAILARIDSADCELIGVHLTFLRPDGSGKADVEPRKAALGRVKGGAVRLAPAAETLTGCGKTQNTEADFRERCVDTRLGCRDGGIRAALE